MFKQLKFSRFFPMAALLVVAVIVLAACASQPAATQAVQEAAPTAEVPAQATSTIASAASTDVPTGAASGASGPAAPASGVVSFSTDLSPILQDSCVSCHGGEKTSKGLDLKTFTSLMAGSENGAVIVAGDATKSKLVQAVKSGKMPKRGTKLTAEQVQLFTDWVNAGAQDN